MIGNILCRCLLTITLSTLVPLAIAADLCGIKNALTVSEDLATEGQDFIDEIVLEEQPESTRAYKILGEYATVNVKTVIYKSSYIQMDLLNGTLIIKSTAQFRHYATISRNTLIRVPIVFGCKGERNFQNVTLIIPIQEENTNPPTFEKSTYKIEIDLPWPGKIPINFEQEIIIRDKDLLEKHAEVSVTASHRFIRVETSKIASMSNETEHVYKIKLFLQSEFEGGEYMVLLTSSDNVFNEYATLVLDMRKSELLVQAEKFCKLIKSPIS